MTTYLFASKEAKEIIDYMTDYEKEKLMNDIALGIETELTVLAHAFKGYVDDMNNVNVRLAHQPIDVDTYYECYELNT